MSCKQKRFQEIFMLDCGPSTFLLACVTSLERRGVTHERSAASVGKPSLRPALVPGSAAPREKRRTVAARLGLPGLHPWESGSPRCGVFRSGKRFGSAREGGSSADGELASNVVMFRNYKLFVAEWTVFLSVTVS